MKIRLYLISELTNIMNELSIEKFDKQRLPQSIQ